MPGTGVLIIIIVNIVIPAKAGIQARVGASVRIT